MGQLAKSIASSMYKVLSRFVTEEEVATISDPIVGHLVEESIVQDDQKTHNTLVDMVSSDLEPIEWKRNQELFDVLSQ